MVLSYLQNHNFSHLMSSVSGSGIVYEWINSFSKHLGPYRACKPYCLESRMACEVEVSERKHTLWNGINKQTALDSYLQVELGHIFY